VRAAVDIVTGASALDVEVRAGIHLGEVEVQPDDIHGLPVNIARRVCDLAVSGQVFITEPVRLLLTGSDLDLASQGSHALKGVPGSWELWAVTG
jgi:class 3 adenylate cyclase